jgi:hypothetical protein
MVRAFTRRGPVIGAIAGFAALGALVALAGCNSSAPAPPADVAKSDVIPMPAVLLPDVDVTPKPIRRTGRGTAGSTWYITSVKDPARGNYTAAVERLSLTQVWFDGADEAAQRATMVLPLHDGRPTDLILSVEHGRFECAAKGRDKACTVRVSVDRAPARPVRFCALSPRSPNSLHLVGGEDARQLLAAIGKGKRLRIQPSFVEEGSP